MYYLPKPTSTTDLTLMRRIDELHLEHPFSGARVLRDLLRLEGHQLGRKHVGTLMARMGIEALYRTSPTPAEASPVHSIYPYLLGDRLVERPRQGDYPRGSFDEMAYPAAHGLELFDLLV